MLAIGHPDNFKAAENKLSNKDDKDDKDLERDVYGARKNPKNLKKKKKKYWQPKFSKKHSYEQWNKEQKRRAEDRKKKGIKERKPTYEDFAEGMTKEEQRLFLNNRIRPAEEMHFKQQLKRTFGAKSQFIDFDSAFKHTTGKEFEREMYAEDTGARKFKDAIRIKPIDSELGEGFISNEEQEKIIEQVDADMQQRVAEYEDRIRFVSDADIGETGVRNEDRGISFPDTGLVINKKIDFSKRIYFATYTIKPPIDDTVSLAVALGANKSAQQNVEKEGLERENRIKQVRKEMRPWTHHMFGIDADPDDLPLLTYSTMVQPFERKPPKEDWRKTMLRTCWHDCVKLPDANRERAKNFWLYRTVVDRLLAIFSASCISLPKQQIMTLREWCFRLNKLGVVNQNTEHLPAAIDVIRSRTIQLEIENHEDEALFGDVDGATKKSTLSKEANSASVQLSKKTDKELGLEWLKDGGGSGGKGKASVTGLGLSEDDSEVELAHVPKPSGANERYSLESLKAIFTGADEPSAFFYQAHPELLEAPRIELTTTLLELDAYEQDVFKGIDDEDLVRITDNNLTKEKLREILVKQRAGIASYDDMLRSNQVERERINREMMERTRIEGQQDYKERRKQQTLLEQRYSFNQFSVREDLTLKEKLLHQRTEADQHFRKLVDQIDKDNHDYSALPDEAFQPYVEDTFSFVIVCVEIDESHFKENHRQLRTDKAFVDEENRHYLPIYFKIKYRVENATEIDPDDF